MSKTSRTLIASCCLLFVFSCNQAPTEAIRIGISPWPGYELLYLAQEKAFYRQAGLNVQIVEFSSLGDVLRAYEQGNIDGMACTLTEVILAKQQSSRDPKIVSLLDFSNGADAIIAYPPISNIKGLRNKNIGVETNSLGLYILSRALELNDMTLNDVRIIPLTPANQELAFNKKEIDAAVIYPPVLNRLMRNAKAKILFSSADIPQEVIDMLVFDAEILKTREQEIAKILNVWDQTMLYAKQNSAESHKIMAAKELITPKEFHESLKGLEFLPLAEQVDLFRNDTLVKNNIDKMYEFLVYTKQIEVDTKANNLIDPSIINSLLETH